jgi:surface protein
MSSKVHPQTPVITKKNGVTVQTILEDLQNLDPSLYTQCADALKADVAVVNVLNKLGFIQEAEHIAALLPPQLRDFSIIKEEETIAAALNAPSFVAAQKAMQSAPNDPNNLTALQAEIAKVMPIYETAIQTRLQEDGISATCRKVIQAGNEDFEGVYQNVWDLTNKSDEKGCLATEKAIAGIVLPKTSIKQTTRDPAVLLQQAASIQPTYKKTVLEIAATVDGVKVSLPSGLKKMGRIIEKTILKRKEDPGNADKVCDIVRGMIECTNMSQIAAIIDGFQARQDVTVTRIKDRFFKAPSAGGWRDIMINFYLNSDSNKHICELQLVHTQMMTARKGLPGHAVYNRVRNASELLLSIPNVPQNKEELQQWLIEYHCGKDWKKGDPKNGDIFTRGHPNLWDVSLITDMSNLFNKDGLYDFNEIISNWNVSNVTTMEMMFNYSKTFNQPIDKWDVSNVTDMKWMFCGTEVFNQPIDKWNVSNVTNMEIMFQDSKAFRQALSDEWKKKAKYVAKPRNKEQLQKWLIEYHTSGDKSTLEPPNLWDVGLITDMSMLFANEELQDFNENISSWDVSNVTTMAYMFNQSLVFNQPIGNWNVSNVTTMESMFEGAKVFNQPVDKWDVSTVTNMENMFYGSEAFKQTLPDEWKKKLEEGVNE